MDDKIEFKGKMHVSIAKKITYFLWTCFSYLSILWHKISELTQTLQNKLIIWEKNVPLV